jgi:hypothetical protein
MESEIALLDKQAEGTQADIHYKNELTREVEQKKKLIKRQIQRLIAQLKKMEQIGGVYEGFYGKMLVHIEALTSALGIHGLVGLGFGKGRKAKTIKGFTGRGR